jgi:hypothetical protein
MTPQRNIGGIGANGVSSSPYNQISSMGQIGTTNADSPDVSQQDETENPADKLMTDFGALMNQVKNFMQSYKGNDEESQAVMDALTKYVTSAAQSLNSPEAPSRMY